MSHRLEQEAYAEEDFTQPLSSRDLLIHAYLELSSASDEQEIDALRKKYATELLALWKEPLLIAFDQLTDLAGRGAVPSGIHFIDYMDRQYAVIGGVERGEGDKNPIDITLAYQSEGIVNECSIKTGFFNSQVPPDEIKSPIDITFILRSHDSKYKAIIPSYIATITQGVIQKIIFETKQYNSSGIPIAKEQNGFSFSHDFK